MSGGQTLKEELIEFIKSLLSLHPAYTRVSRILIDAEKGRSATEIFMRYPELLQEMVAPLFNDLFNVTFGLRSSTSGLGYRVTDLIDLLEGKLCDEKARKMVELVLKISVPNPCKDYVKLCMDTLKDKDPVAVKLLLLIDEKGGSISVDALLDEVRKRGLVEDKDRLMAHIDVLEALNLATRSDTVYVYLHERYRKYLRELGGSS